MAVAAGLIPSGALAVLVVAVAGVLEVLLAAGENRAWAGALVATNNQ